MKKHRNILKAKDKIKPQKKNLNEVEISNDKEFKVLAIKMLTEIRRMKKHRTSKKKKKTENTGKF